MSTEQPQEGGHKKPPIPTPAKKVPAYNIEKRGDRLYEVQSLHKWFAISSLLFFLFTVGMVLQDYSREWKRYQRDFVQLSLRNTLEEGRAAQAALESAGRAQVEQERDAAQAAEQQNSADIARLEKEAADLNAKWIAADQKYKFEKAEYDADRYTYEEKVARNEATNEETERIRVAGEELDKLFLDREIIESDRQRARDELAKLRSKSIELQQKLETMEAEFNRLVRQYRSLNPGELVTAIINAPLMDFMRPSLQIKQILLPNLFYDQPFKQISRADRCTTCHLGIDNKKFEMDENGQPIRHPFRTHPNLDDLYVGANSAHPMEKFGCTSCHGGLDRSTDFITAGHTPRDEEQRKNWESRYGWRIDAAVRHYLETPMLPMPNIEAGCYKCHNASPEVPRAPALDNGRTLIRIYGCFGCHKMPGYEGIRKVGPDLSTVSGKLTQDWVKKWLANPKDFKSEARMPKFWYNSNNTGVQNGVDWDKRNVAEINAITAYLFANSKPRNLPSKNSSGNPARGKMLVESVGCFGCHAVGPIEEAPNRPQTGRRHGYNLANQGSKVSANWIANWISDPRQVWPDSKMPSLRLSDSEVGDITAYLSSLKNADWEKKAAPQTDPAMLDEIVLQYLRAGSTEARAKSRLAEMSADEKNLYAGKELIGRYGCYSCHNIPGFENAQPIGTELTEAGSKLISQLDFGFLDLEHSREEWYTAKLRDPRVFDQGRIKKPEELLKMPNFGLSEKDIHSIVMVLTSMVKDPVPLEMKERAPQAVIAGRQLVAEKNCKGCHIVENLGGDIRALLGVDGELNWPPSLNTQGLKTQPEWLRDFLKDPGKNRPRPWMDTRMPTFHFSEHEITVLRDYFAALDKVDSAWIEPVVETTSERLKAGEELFKLGQCMRCHPTGSVSTAGADAGLAPNLQMAHNRLRPEWIRPWLLDPSKIAPNTRMPNFFGEPGRRKTQFPEILKGDIDAQIEAIRDYLFTLGGGRVTVK